ncbi:MAG: YHS domain-containing (seleno)protein [Primorskyibacter sp.]
MPLSLTRRATFGLLAAGAATLIARPALAREPEVFQSGGVAINGTDPVAYFTQSLPVAGSSDYTVEWNGATWQFSSAENAATFAADPMTFAPVFGGRGRGRVVSRPGCRRAGRTGWCCRRDR